MSPVQPTKRLVTSQLRSCGLSVCKRVCNGKPVAHVWLLAARDCLCPTKPPMGVAVQGGQGLDAGRDVGAVEDPRATPMPKAEEGKQPGRRCDMLATIQLVSAERRFRQQRVLLSLQTLSWPGIEGGRRCWPRVSGRKKIQHRTASAFRFPPSSPVLCQTLTVLYMSW